MLGGFPSGLSDQKRWYKAYTLFPVSALETFIGQGVHCNNEFVFIANVLPVEVADTKWFASLIPPPGPLMAYCPPYVLIYINDMVMTRTLIMASVGGDLLCPFIPQGYLWIILLTVSCNSSTKINTYFFVVLGSPSSRQSTMVFFLSGDIGEISDQFSWCHQHVKIPFKRSPSLSNLLQC